MRTAAIYARVSTTDQVRGTSLDTQVDECKAYAQQHGYNVTKEIREDFTGAQLARPGLDDIRDMAQSHEIDAVIVAEQDRLSRSLAHTMLLMEEMERNNIEMLFVREPQDGTPEGRMLFQMKGMFKEYERLKIAERTRRGKERRAKDGRILGTGNRPFGYRYIKGEGRYEIDEGEAYWVRQIFQWLNVEGTSMRQIALRMTAAGVSTTAGKTRWGGSSVYSIISNTTYTGMCYWNKRKWLPQKKGYSHRPMNEWLGIPVPALISQADFDLAQVRLQRNKDLAVRNCKTQYLLRGLVRCELCKSSFVGHKSHGRPYYYCQGSKLTPQLDPTKRCPLTYIGASRLENRVWDKLMEKISNPLDIQEAFEQAQQLTEQDRHRDDETLASIYASEEATKREINMLLDLHRDGDIDRDTFRQRMAVVKKQQQGLESTRAEILLRTEQSQQTQATREMLEVWCIKVSKGLPLMSFEHKRAFLIGMNPRITTDGVNVDFNGMLNLGRYALADAEGAQDGSIASSVSRYACSRRY